MENTFIQDNDKDFKKIKYRYDIIYVQLKRIEKCLHDEQKQINKKEKRKILSFFVKKEELAKTINEDKINFYAKYISNLGEYLMNTEQNRQVFKRETALERDLYIHSSMTDMEFNQFLFDEKYKDPLIRDEFIFFIFYLLGKQIALLNRSLVITDNNYASYDLKFFSLILCETNKIAEFLLNHDFDYIVENYEEFYKTENENIQSFKSTQPQGFSSDAFICFFEIGNIMHRHLNQKK